jgi:hypothetical protein
MHIFYFAHPTSDYDTYFEAECIRILRELHSVHIENPNSPIHALGYETSGMYYFINGVLPHCHGCIFVTMPCGGISAGVHKEVLHFLDEGKPVYHLFANSKYLDKIESREALSGFRVLTVEETRRKLSIYKNMPNGGR